MLTTVIKKLGSTHVVIYDFLCGHPFIKKQDYKKYK